MHFYGRMAFYSLMFLKKSVRLFSIFFFFLTGFRFFFLNFFPPPICFLIVSLAVRFTAFFYVSFS